MLDFISIPLITWIVFSFIYRLFSLYARKRERIMILEKSNFEFSKSLGDQLDEAPLINLSKKRFNFIALRCGCLAVGIGLGLLIGGFLFYYYGIDSEGTAMQNNLYSIKEIFISSSVLLFGGLGLLISFLIEHKILKENLKK
ncbi:MAG: DUF6249 domain-containing protein [Candidatus Paceibacterota bacterium]